MTWPSLMFRSGSESTAKAVGTTLSYTKRSNPGTPCDPGTISPLVASDGGCPQTFTLLLKNAKAALWLCVSEPSPASWSILCNKDSKLSLLPRVHRGYQDQGE